MNKVKMNLNFTGNSNNYNLLNPRKNFIINKNNITSNSKKEKKFNNINNNNEFIEIKSVYDEPGKNISKNSGYKNVGSLMSYVANGKNYPKKNCGCGGG